jgi:hypothetical protein
VLLLLLLLFCCQVDEVKGIMMQNVEQVLVRGERLDVLVDRTDDLRDQVGRGRQHQAAAGPTKYGNLVTSS